MKSDEGAKEEDGHPTEESKPSTSKKKTEPAFEMRTNFSRVTPAQLAYISFPSDGRYQPVRPVSMKSQTSKSSKLVAGGSPSVIGLGSEKYAGGGGILILTDSRPNEPAEFIDTSPAPVAAVAPVPVPVSGHIPVHVEPTGHHIALDENSPEADPPEPFEVCKFLAINNVDPEYCLLVSF
jgi:26S proteasome regulatory subunit N2